VCGVAGIFVAPEGPKVELGALRSMVAMLGYRGPDGYGLYRDTAIGLAHARLSIIDLEGGFQPLTGEDRSVWLSFNGEIFNYVELRRSLRAQGHQFVTDGDSEVIVHLYEQYGSRAWAQLNGQFAFALWDGRVQQLWLVRDRLGILPMYYARVGSQLLFASEAKALFANGALQATIDPGAVRETFVHWSTRPPRSLFSGVQSVRAGTGVRFDANLCEHEERYWGLGFVPDPSTTLLDTDTAADQLSGLLDSAVRIRLRSDVPVGAYLSGGLDSSVIGALIRSVDSSPLETFAIRFTEASFDETDEQRRVVRLLGTKHHEVVCGDREIRDAIASVVWHCESALLRTAPVPLFILSRLVRDQGMKVVLTGEGADELFAGYSIFKEDKIRRFWARAPSSTLRPRLLSLVHSEVTAGAARNSELWRSFFGKGLTDVGDPCYSHRIRWDNTAWTLRVLAPDLREQTGTLDPDLPPKWLEWDPLARAQWLETETFMTPYLLSFQGDRVAMAHGVEVRYPFLDPQVVEFATHLPARLKMPGLRDKLTLRRLASRLLPEDVAMRPKLPYRAPMTSPFFGPDSGDFAADALSPEECVRYGLVDAEAIGRLVRKARRAHGALTGEREQMALVGALTLQLLARSFADDFALRAREARDVLDHLRPHVLEDRVAAPGAYPSVTPSTVVPS